MRLASLILLSFASSSSSSSLFLSRRHEVEAGFWDVTVSKGTSAEGMVWHDVFSVYSGAPDATVHCSYVRGSQAGAVGETECDGVGSAGFRYEWNAEAGVQNMKIQQTVELVVDGVRKSVNITGVGPVDLTCGLGFARRACEGAGRVNATLVD